MSGGSARMSGDVSIPNPFAKDYVRSDIAFSSNAVLYEKLSCLRVSGWCLDGVWGCLDGPTLILDAANRVLMPKQVIKVQLV